MNRKTKSKILLGSFILSALFTHAFVYPAVNAVGGSVERRLSQQAQDAKLYHAVLKCDNRSAQYWLEQGANPNAEFNMVPIPQLHSPITIAIANENLEMIELLCRYGLKITEKNSLGKSAIDYANEFGKKEIFKYLSAQL